MPTEPSRSASTSEAISAFVGDLSLRLIKDAPPLLWHYTSAKGALGIIQDRKLHLGHITAMNDALEYRYALRSLVNAMKPVLSGGVTQSAGRVIKLAIERIEAQLPLTAENIERTPPLFVGCFTGTVDKTNHWGEYGSRGRGYALGFRYSDVVHSVGNRGAFLFRCEYDPAEADRIMGKVVSFVVQMSETVCGADEVNANARCTAFLDELLWNLTFLAPVFKNTAFSHEDEWRIVVRLPDHAYEAMTFCDRRDEIRPHISIDLRGERGQDALSAVIVGPSRPDVDIQLAIAALRGLTQKCKYSQVSVQASESAYRG